MQNQVKDTGAANTLIETRSIDYIPESERHGKLFSQFTLWLGTNLQITAIVTGALAVVLGGDVFWSLTGLLIGQLLGGTVMALHAAQGPQLGLPQMISSRVQFGVYGAVIPIILVCFMYVGFSASGTVLAGQALGSLFGISGNAGILGFGVLIIILTLFGYRLIHLLGRAASLIGVTAFVVLFGALIARHDLLQVMLSDCHFTLPHFLLAVSLSASWQLAYGPYVADYSRYLPSAVQPWKTFLAVGSGAVLGTQASMTVGVFAAALAGKQFAGNEVGFIVGLGGGGLMAGFLYFSIVFGKVIATTLNSYGSFMSLATIVSGFKGSRTISPTVRLAYIVLTVGLSTALALLGQHSFLHLFKSFILFLLAFFTPWSAINLVDFYCITKSRYDLKALSDPNGRYGRWNRVGIVVYLLGIVMQLPFLATGFYTGPMVERLGDTDISWIVGLVIPALLYYWAARRWPVPIPEKLMLPDSGSL